MLGEYNGWSMVLALFQGTTKMESLEVSAIFVSCSDGLLCPRLLLSFGSE